MKPLFTIDTLLGTPVTRRAVPPGGSAADDLAHRLIQIVLANGEGLATAEPTRATALLQHGLKEWGAARGVGVVQQAGDLVPQLRDCEEQNLMPLVLCRDMQLPLQTLAHMRNTHGDCGLLALGSPADLRHRPRPADLSGLLFPFQVPDGLDPSRCAWLGAPTGQTLPALGRSFGLPGLRVNADTLRSTAMEEVLHRVDRHFKDREPCNVWCVIHLDDVALGDHRSASAGAVAPETVAKVLRWLQQLIPWVVVILVSQRAVSGHERDAVAQLARQLGLALHRHRGVRRDSFPAPGASRSAARRDPLPEPAASQVAVRTPGD